MLIVFVALVNFVTMLSDLQFLKEDSAPLS